MDWLIMIRVIDERIRRVTRQGNAEDTPLPVHAFALPGPVVSSAPTGRQANAGWMYAKYLPHEP